MQVTSIGNKPNVYQNPTFNGTVSWNVNNIVFNAAKNDITNLTKKANQQHALVDENVLKEVFALKINIQEKLKNFMKRFDDEIELSNFNDIYTLKEPEGVTDNDQLRQKIKNCHFGFVIDGIKSVFKRDVDTQQRTFNSELDRINFIIDKLISDIIPENIEESLVQKLKASLVKMAENNKDFGTKLNNYKQLAKRTGMSDDEIAKTEEELNNIQNIVSKNNKLKDDYLFYLCYNN